MGVALWEETIDELKAEEDPKCAYVYEECLSGPSM
jgi:hypothetical protein